MTIPPRPTVTSTSSNHSPSYGRWSTSGSDWGNAHFFTATSNTIEGTGKKKKELTNKMLGVNSSAEGELCNTLCMCRLTLVWILAKLPQSNWNADSIFFHWSGLYLLPTRLSAPVSDVDCLCQSSVANCPLRAPFVQPTLFSRPVTTSGHGEISSPKPFVWFRAKTDKGIVCLAGHLHSVTISPNPN